MDAKEYWQLFLETGAPELYLMYTSALKTEGTHVPESPGAGAAGHGLQ
jgi:hypothetical protein